MNAVSRLSELLPIAEQDVLHDGLHDTQQEISLSALERGRWATVTNILPAATQEDQELVLRLIEIGFFPGERVRVVAHGHPGREPLALRLGGAGSGTNGGASFALRRFEADYIRVVPDLPLT